MTKEWIVPKRGGWGGWMHFWPDDQGWIVHDEVNLDVEFTTPLLSDFLEQVRLAGSVFIEDPEVDIDSSLEYDSCRVDFTIRGKRRATADEIEYVERWIAEEPDRARQKAESERQIAVSKLQQLRVQHPELFATSPDARLGETND